LNQADYKVSAFGKPYVTSVAQRLAEELDKALDLRIEK
jgi:hypothetical protein